jgi:probable H4MPT-linked C1 transfer pathway protein
MPPTVLGLDIGGANLKAATPDRRAASVPFALWKEPDRLPAVLAELVARFPDADELAVTMTGELCDCFETKRAGVNAILTAVLNVSRSRPVRVWTTDGTFADTEEARRNHLKVASANWHALATLAGQYVPTGPAILVDVGSTTTDIVPLLDGTPVPQGLTDYDRLTHGELVYTGVRRTPLCAILGRIGAAELFATTLDVYLTLGLIPEDPSDTDTADGRPATKACARARIARMLCGDADTIPPATTDSTADGAYKLQADHIRECFDRVEYRLKQMPGMKERESVPAIVSGSGEFLARRVAGRFADEDGVSLTDRLGPEVSACAPAYAVAVLAAEGRARPLERITRGLWPWSGA